MRGRGLGELGVALVNIEVCSSPADGVNHPNNNNLINSEPTTTLT